MRAWRGVVAIGGLAGLAGLVWGCGEAPAADRGAESEVTASMEWIQGTPPGGLEDWVREIREGIRGLAEEERGAAQRRALELYVGRQEYLEMYFGPAGRISRGGALGSAVLEAEARFHDLLQLLGKPAVERAEVEAAVAALDERLVRVVEEARAAGVRAVPVRGAE